MSGRNANVNIDNVLQLTGDDEKLRELLIQRLIQCGWEAELKQACSKIIQEKGLDNVTLDSLIEMLTPMGREKIPAEVKKEMLEKIRGILMKHGED